MAAIQPKPPKGRPRSFDTAKALDSALQVFWCKGYEGASLSDLTTAMGINRPSLYAAFGDKEALFRKVLDRYAEGPVRYIDEAMHAATAREVVERLLLGTANLLGDLRNPRGCLAVQSALACGADAKPIQQELVRRRSDLKAALRRRLKRAQAEGDLSRTADSAALAGYIATVIHGMAVQAASGVKRAELRRVASTALRAWPTR